MRWLPILALFLAGCDRAPGSQAVDGPGARLEAAAASVGLVPDLDTSIAGSWGLDTDRLCVVDGPQGTRIGATIDYGEGQNCAASGTVSRLGGKLDVRFGPCRFDARFDGERIVFPPTVPEACESLCTGRASLAALTVERLSDSRSEATTMRSGKGDLLCGH